MRDLRYAIRFLWLHKTFTAAAVLTLAIGLGANTALYGLLNSVLRPLDLPDPDRIVAIAAELPDDDTGGFQFKFALDVMEELQARAAPFSAIVGSMPRIGGLSHGNRSAQFWFTAVSNNYFSGLGVKPALGTLFTKKSGSPVHVVLGHAFWIKMFGGDPSVIGTAIRLDGAPAVITGVVASSFRGTLTGVEFDGYLALEDYGLLSTDVQDWLYTDRKARAIDLFGRLKPGVSLGQAQAAMDVLMASIAAEHPATDQGVGARVIPETQARPLPTRAVGEAIPFVRFFGQAIAGLVLLLACLNVGNLLLVRATARQHEMAVRAAMGASRGRLVRQMAVEGLVLSALGALAGGVIGLWITNAYLSRLDLGVDLPLRLDVEFDLNVFLFSLAATILTGVLIGLWPAWRAARADPRGALHEGARSQSNGGHRQRVHRLLVVGQIAGALALLVVAGLFARTLSSAQRIDLGFSADRLITVRLDPRSIGYDDSRTDGFYKELQRRVAAWPGVESVAIAFTTPMSYLLQGGALYVEGHPLPASGQPPTTFLNKVGHGYFETMGIPIMIGRPFVEDDEQPRANSRRVAIVNESMAAKYWPGQNPIGKRLQLYGPTEPLLEVVGVARDSKYVLVFESPRPYIYLPLERDLSLRTLHVRASADPAALAPLLEHLIQELGPGLPLSDLRTMRQSLGGIFGFLIFRIGALQAGGMGVLGLALAVVGVYGVVSFSAKLRTREIGIRVALGAQPQDVLRLMLVQGLRLLAAGLAIGLAVSVVMARVLAGFLPLVDDADWLTFLAVSTGLSMFAISACYIPARRATRVPVVTALRHE